MPREYHIIDPMADMPPERRKLLNMRTEADLVVNVCVRLQSDLAAFEAVNEGLLLHYRTLRKHLAAMKRRIVQTRLGCYHQALIVREKESMVDTPEGGT